MFGLLAVLWFSANGAEGQLPEGVNVSWRTQTACTRPSDLALQVARLLGPSQHGITPTSFDVEVRSSTSEQYELTLAMEQRGARAERHVVLPNCREVEDAAVILIAITLDPSSALRAQQTERVPSPPATASPTESAADAVQTRGVRSVFARPVLLLAGVFDLQTLPAPTAGPLLALEFAPSRIRFWFQGHYLTPSEVHNAMSAAGARVELFAGALGAAYAKQLRQFSVGPCVEAELGYLRVSGLGVHAARTAGAAWYSGLLGARLEYALSARFGLRLQALLGAPFQRPRVALHATPVFYETLAARRAVAARPPYA